MNFWRPFIPSWRFFDQVGDQARLWVRIGTNYGKLGEWKSCIPTQTRRPLHLFLNPKGNLALAQHAAVDRLAQDLENKNLEESVSFRIVKQIVSEFVIRTPGPRTLLRYQFRIEIRNSTRDSSYDALISEEYET